MTRNTILPEKFQDQLSVLREHNFIASTWLNNIPICMPAQELSNRGGALAFELHGNFSERSLLSKDLCNEWCSAWDGRDGSNGVCGPKGFDGGKPYLDYSFVKLDVNEPF